MRRGDQIRLRRAARWRPRPMLSFFANPAVRAALGELSQVESLTVVVGAGASAEVGLPTWAQLVRGLLTDVLGKQRHWGGHRQWLSEQILTAGDLLTAAEHVEILMSAGNLSNAIKARLYQGESPRAVKPGPLTKGVAAMQLAYGRTMRIATTNYDQLLLTALRAAGITSAESYCSPSRRANAIIHLHGVIGYRRPYDGDNEVVLTEGQFLNPRSGWRSEFMRSALERPCLFLGASLTDLNILRSLHAQGTRPALRHYVLFVRDPARSDKERQRREIWEQIETTRWSKLGVTPLFADNYADVAQFGFELAGLRRGGLDPIATRFDGWFSQCQQTVLSPSPKAFRQNQTEYSDVLSGLLAGLHADLELKDEVLSLGICAVFPPAEDGTQERPVNWVTSDRAMTTPATLEYIPLERDSQWTGVKAIAAGMPRNEDKDSYSSRWRFVWAVPIYREHPDRIPVGAVMLSTRSPRAESRLPIAGGRRYIPGKRLLLEERLSEVGRAILVAPSAETVTV